MNEVSFEMIVAMVDRLSPQEQTQLTTHLLDMAKKRDLSVAEKMSLLRAIQINGEFVEETSIRREDWYGDDGR